MFDQRVVMAGQDCAQTLGRGHSCRLMGGAHLFTQGLARCDMFVEHCLRKAMLAHHISAILPDIGELALAGRMVHQAHDAHTVIWAELIQLRDQGFRANLGAQMDMVADLQRTRRPHDQKHIGQIARIARPAHPTCPFDGADTDRVIDRGNATGRKLGVMGRDRGLCRPMRRGARPQMPLQIVGMQLDQARRDDITAAIHRPRRHRRTARNLDDFTARDGHASQHLTLGQDEPGIGKGQRLGHQGSVFGHWRLLKDKKR